MMWCLQKAQVLDRLSTDSLRNRGSYGDHIPNLLFLPSKTEDALGLTSPICFSLCLQNQYVHKQFICGGNDDTVASGENDGGNVDRGDSSTE